MLTISNLILIKTMCLLRKLSMFRKKFRVSISLSTLFAFINNCFCRIIQFSTIFPIFIYQKKGHSWPFFPSGAFYCRPALSGPWPTPIGDLLKNSSPKQLPFRRTPLLILHSTYILLSLRGDNKIKAQPAIFHSEGSKNSTRNVRY